MKPELHSALLRAHSESHVSGKFRLSGVTTTRSAQVARLVTLTYLRVGPEGQQPKCWTLAVGSNCVLGRNMIKLQFDFECLFLPRPPQTVSSLSEKLKDWQNRDWKPLFFFSVTSIWAGRDFTLLKFAKSVAMCTMRVFLFISFFFLSRVVFGFSPIGF